jgi:molecular chaperone GrpE
VDPDVRTIPEEGSGGADMGAQMAALTAERDRLAAEKAELQDMLLRRQADFENYRKRAERDRSDFLQFAGMEFVRELLPILDDFERAHQAVEKVETDQAADQSILGEFQKGYTFKGKLLRPAMVRVAVRPS